MTFNNMRRRDAIEQNESGKFTRKGKKLLQIIGTQNLGCVPQEKLLSFDKQVERMNLQTEK